MLKNVGRAQASTQAKSKVSIDKWAWHKNMGMPEQQHTSDPHTTMHQLRTRRMQARQVGRELRLQLTRK